MELAIAKAFEEMKVISHDAVKRTTGHFNQNIATMKLDLIKNVDMAKSTETPITAAMEERWLKHIVSMHEQLAEYASNMHFNLEENIEKAKVSMVSLFKEEIVKCMSNDMHQQIKEMVLVELKQDTKDHVQQLKEMILMELKKDVKEDAKEHGQQIKEILMALKEDAKKRDSAHEDRLSNYEDRFSNHEQYILNHEQHILSHEQWDLEKSSPILELREDVKRLDGKIIERFGMLAREIGTSAHLIEGNVDLARAECLARLEACNTAEKFVKAELEQYKQRLAEVEKLLLANPASDEVRLNFPAARNTTPFKQITVAPANGNNVVVEKGRKFVVDVVPNEDFDPTSLGPHPAVRRKCVKNFLGMDEDGKRSASDSRLVRNWSK